MKTRKITRFATVSFVCMLGLLSVQAKTTTWQGAASATGLRFDTAANWSDGVPEPGDTIIIHKDSGSASGNPVTVGAADEEFDIGSAGLTIQVNSGCYAKFLVNFKGSGKIVKTGQGMFGVAVNSEHTGGTEIRNGSIRPYLSSLGFGTGPIEFASSDSATPTIYSYIGWGMGITNAVVFSGTRSYKVISVSNAFSFKGPVSSTHDFEVEEKYGSMNFLDDVSAPGYTFTVKGNRAEDSTLPNIYFEKAVDANIVKTGNRTMFLNGSTTNPDNSLTVSNGTCSIAAAGYWGGTNIMVEATATAFSLDGSANLAPEAVIRIDTTGGAPIDIASGVKVQIARLFVNGVEQVPGIYTAATLPGTISGNGELLVLGDSPFVWTGADEDNPTQWSVAANWKGNAVPGDGAVVYFSKDVVVSNTASTVAVGASGLTFVLDEKTVDLRDPLSGSGALTVSGTGRLNLDDAATHTGGTTISGSAVLTPYAKTSPLGTEGTITIDGSGGGNPFLHIPLMNTAIPNDIVINGVITNRASTYSGKTSYGAIQLDNGATFNGSISGDNDILLTTRFSYMTLNGSITVPEGKTIRLRNLNTGNDARIISASGTLTGNLSVEGGWPVRLASTATCSGNVSVASTATLQLNAAENLAETAVVSVETGGQIDIASDVKVQVAELYVGGVQQPHGVYNATNLPAVITGAGSLRVGDPKGFTLIIY